MAALAATTIGASMTKQLLFDFVELRRAWKLMFQQGQVTEIRVLDATTAENRYPQTVFGFFDGPEPAVKSLSSLRSFSNVYAPLHRVDPDLFARAANRLKRAEKGKAGASTANDIIERLWLLIDCDPIRKAGISSTDAEHATAIARTKEVREYLTTQGWPSPILADSGNGGHLLYRTSLPVDDHALTEKCLTSLAARFSDNRVHVDQSVFDPPRLRKLYGSLACKGDSIPARPHRMSRILEAPDTLEIVPL
jgi:hypothetical protein